MSSLTLPLFPTDEELHELSLYLTDRGWQCIAPPPARTWPVSAPVEEELTHARARRDDRATSKAGAAAVAPRAGSQRARLLAAYASQWMGEWTDEEAAERAGLLGSCYWKRCGELREGGWIEVLYVDGQEVTRTGSAGSPRFVCRITPAGRALHATLNP